jgi:5'-nucleotidase
MRLYLYSLVLFSSLLSPISYAKTITIFHTNDEHSRFLGFAPDSEYDPSKTGDGTIGGIARVGQLLKQRREIAKSKGPVLTLQAGDFSMGTLFHTITREKGAELQMIKLLAYDAITLGNHEFDLGVKGLIQMIGSARREIGSLPPILASNLVLTEKDPRDEGLRQLVKENVLKPYTVIEKEGTRFGILGIMGTDAAEVTTNHLPVQFSDPIKITKHFVKMMKEKEKVDYIIVLSHSGVTRDDPDWKGTELLTVGDDGKWFGEDIDLAKAVPEIDVIVGGHTHTPFFKPLIVGKTTIVQAGSDLRYLGELELESDHSRTKLSNYHLHPIDDTIVGDAAITAKVNEFKAYIDATFLQPLHTKFDQATAKINKTITRDYSDNALGHLLSTAFKKGAQADIGFCPDGVIRDEIFVGRTGIQSFSDIFRLIPLGKGETDDSIGYPMIKVFVTGKEMKQILETLLLAYKLKGSNYHPRLSGIEFTFNPYRTPLDQVVEAHLIKDMGGLQRIDFEDETKLYSVGTLSYVGKFFWVVPEVSMGLFNVIPKFSDGRPLQDIKDAVVKVGNTSEEYKGWRALLDYIRSLPLDAKTGLPLIPTEGKALKHPMMEYASFAPTLLFKNATWIQWAGASLFFLGFFTLLFLAFWSKKRIMKNRCRQHLSSF